MPVTYIFNCTAYHTVPGMVRPSQILRRARFDPARWGLLVEYPNGTYFLLEDDAPFDLQPETVTRMYPVATCSS